MGEHDGPILKHLVKVEVIKQKDPSLKLSKIIFKCHFEENEFFTNDCLTSTLHYDDEEIIKVKGTKIDWKKNPTEKKVKKKQINKRTKKIRYKEKKV